MKKISASVLLTSMLLILIFGLYGLFAFANWDVNPYCWEVVSRVICAFMMGCIFLSWAVVMIMIYSGRE